MTFYTNIAFFATAQGLFLGLVLCCLQRGNRLANVLLGLLIIVFSLWMAEFAAYFTDAFFQVPHLLFSTVGLPLLFGPILFFYGRALRKKPLFTNRWDWLHFLPFLLHTIYYLPFFLQSAATKTDVFRQLINVDNPPEFSTYFYINESSKFLHLLIYLLLTQRKGLHATHHTWINTLVLGLSLFAVFDLSHLLGLFLFQYDYLFIIAKGMLFSGALVVYYIGYATLRQPTIIDGVPVVSTANSRYQKSSLNEEKAQKYLKQLLTKTEKEKYYLNSDLKLKDLAAAIDISTHHLSQILNEYLHKSFFDFINEYRVKAAQDMLRNPDLDHYTILSIAFDAGFKSKASFNAAFKKYTGQTPSGYRTINRSLGPS